MKAMVKKVDTFETTVVEVLCPACGEVNTYDYPHDEGFYHTEREESCSQCEIMLEFCYGKKCDE